MCLYRRASITYVDRCNGNVAFCAISAQVLDTAACRTNRAAQAGATQSMYDLFILDAGFLCCKGVRHRYGTVYLGIEFQYTNAHLAI
jgi:hypothetical protein